MKIIGIEEHYGLPFIHDAAFKADDPYGLVLETMRKSGQFPRKPKDRAPSGHLRSGRGESLRWTTLASTCRSLRTRHQAQFGAGSLSLDSRRPN
jgi:hypothetical protein